MATCPQPNVEALMSDQESDLQRTRNRLPVERSVAASAPNDLPGNGTVGCKRMSGESNSALFARHYARHPAFGCSNEHHGRLTSKAAPAVPGAAFCCCSRR